MTQLHDDVTPMLIPQPSQVSLNGMSVVLPYRGMIAIGPAQDREACLVMAQQLQDDLEGFAGLRWGLTVAVRWDAEIRLDFGADLAAGDYRLRIAPPVRDVDSRLMQVLGGDLAGLRYGVQTLRQLIRQYGAALPSLDIADGPSIPVRSVSYDVSRGRVPTLATLKRLTDLICLYKFNQLQLYVEDAIDIPDTTEAWMGHSPLTAEEIVEFDRYCALRGIELVPTMATFGHMYDILRTNRYRQLGEFPENAGRPFSFVERMLHHTFNPMNQGSLDFMLRRIDRYSGLFSSDKFNIGCDETFDLGAPGAASGLTADDIPSAYTRYAKALCEHLESFGKHPIMYADIAVKHSELLSALPADTVFANWDYLAKPWEGGVRLVSQSGHSQYVCPGVQTWNRLLPDLDAAWQNISLMCLYAHEYDVQGVMATDWGDYGHINDPVMSVPGMLYTAECSWNRTSLGRDELDRRISALAFGDSSGQLTAIIGRAGAMNAFSWADVVQYKELDDGGQANRDILGVLGIDGEPSLDQAREIFLDQRHERTVQWRSFNEGLGGVDVSLAGLSRELRSQSAEAVATVRLFVAGQRILNGIGGWLNADDPGSVDVAALTKDIEEWWPCYERRWRDIGKEADLRSILDVLRWYVARLA